jgi:hypothetical protein
MELSFNATYVDCSNAIDWEIQQVLFDTVSDESLESGADRRSPYVLLSCAFEVSHDPEIEWHDGSDYDGGASIRSVVLERRKIVILLEKSRRIAITFNLGEKKFEMLHRYLQNMCGRKLKARSLN